METWYLENGLGREKIVGSKVIELGSGVGFTSLVAKSLGADEVVVTDGNEQVLDLAEKNIKLNFPKSDPSKLRIARLRWNTPDEIPFTQPDHPWDYILVSDCTYRKNAWPDLLATISRLSGPRTRTILEIEPRSIEEVSGVLTEAQKSGMRWQEERLPVDPERDQCSLLCSRLFTLSKETPAVAIGTQKGDAPADVPGS